MSSMKQLLESLDRLDEAGRGGPNNVQPLDPKIYPPLKIGDIDNSPQGKGRKILSASVSGDGTVVRAQYGDIWSVKYGPMPEAPQPQAQTQAVTGAQNVAQPQAQQAQTQAVTGAQNVAQPSAVDPQASQQLAKPQGDFGNFGSIEKVRLSLDGVKKLTGLKETIIFKSLIGRALLETTSILTESDLDQVNKFWPDLVKWADNPANANFDEAQEIQRLREPITKWQASQQQSSITGNSASVQNNASASATPVVGSAALNPANGSANTTIPSGPETAVGGAGIVPAPEKKTIPDVAATLAAGNHPQGETDPQKFAAVNRTTGAMYHNDTIGMGSRDTGEDHRVASLQKLLGINPATGVFGPTEKKAVEELQKKLGVKVDGKYGPETMQAHGSKKANPTFVSPNPENNKGVGNKVSADNQNMAGTKTTLKPDEIAAAKEALADPSISARDKAYYTELLGNQMDPKGDPKLYDRQKQLAALGAKGKDGRTLKTDGIAGDDTKTAEKQFGFLIIDPKTTVSINGTQRPVNPADITHIQGWIKSVKEGRNKMEQVPPVYADIVKKQLAIKESFDAELPMLSTEPTLARIIQLTR